MLRDPTRGGLAAALHEIAHAAGVGFELREDAIAVAPPVQAVCELLGFDPLRLVQLRTRLGGRRVVDWLAGEPLPRIC